MQNDDEQCSSVSFLGSGMNARWPTNAFERRAVINPIDSSHRWQLCARYSHDRPRLVTPHICYSCSSS